MRLRRLSTPIGSRPAALLLAVIAAALMPSAGAASPRDFWTGFSADTLPLGTADARAFFSRMDRLGSSWVRISAAWNAIAPQELPAHFSAGSAAEPRYSWPALDRAVRDATASGQHVLLMLDSPPRWALARGAPRSARPGTWLPDARAYGAFAHAVAQRYSGRFRDPADPASPLPRVSSFQAWNEPNLPTWLAPQWKRSRHGWVPSSPVIYRSLLNAAYAGIKSAQPRAQVLLAGLAPYGDPPGAGRMRPVSFMRALLCLRGLRLRRESCPSPAHFDAIDIHPYSLTPTIHAFNPDDVSVADIGRLTRVVRAAVRAGRALPRASKAVWMTEISWDTSPPDPGGVSLAQQSRYLSLTFYEVWSQGVSHAFWYEVRDVGGAAGKFSGAGLFFSDGQPKPSASAFRFPFVAIGHAFGAVTLWGRAPLRGRVSIELASRHGWHTILSLRPNRAGVFYVQRRLGTRSRLRARVGALVSYPWSAG